MDMYLVIISGCLFRNICTSLYVIPPEDKTRIRTESTQEVHNKDHSMVN